MSKSGSDTKEEKRILDKILDLIFPGRGGKMTRSEIEFAIRSSEAAIKETGKVQEKLKATLNGEDYWMLKCVKKAIDECIDDKEKGGLNG